MALRDTHLASLIYTQESLFNKKIIDTVRSVLVFYFFAYYMNVDQSNSSSFLVLTACVTCFKIVEVFLKRLLNRSTIQMELQTRLPRLSIFCIVMACLSVLCLQQYRYSNLDFKAVFALEVR